MQESGNRLAGVRRITVGGGQLTEPTRRAVETVFIDLENVANVYGMTECMGILCSPSIHGTQGTDVGFPAPWSQIKVVDMVTRQKLGPNETGEICFRTPIMMKEYYKRPKETADLIDQNGWCKSGDAGYYDEDGRLNIVHRLREMFKCMDMQVIPAWLEEQILQAHSDHISEVAVVGVPHEEYGEVAAAVVVLKEHGTNKCDHEHLSKEIKATIAGWCPPGATLSLY
ncbi:luciferin 4-monooxygenase-like [Amblyomma americanum]